MIFSHSLHYSFTADYFQRNPCCYFSFSLKKIIKRELSIWSVPSNQGTFITRSPPHLVINRVDSCVLPLRHMSILFPESVSQYCAKQNVYHPDIRQPKHSAVFVFPAIHLTQSIFCTWWCLSALGHSKNIVDTEKPIYFCILIVIYQAIFVALKWEI